MEKIIVKLTPIMALALLPLPTILLLSLPATTVARRTLVWISWNNWATKGGDQSQPVQLYDLADDIGETTNLAARIPARVGQLQELLETLIKQGRSTPGPRQKNDVRINRFAGKAKR